jgi:hypothetical protein
MILVNWSSWRVRFRCFGQLCVRLFHCASLFTPVANVRVEFCCETIKNSQCVHARLCGQKSPGLRTTHPIFGFVETSAGIVEKLKLFPIAEASITFRYICADAIRGPYQLITRCLFIKFAPILHKRIQPITNPLGQPKYFRILQRFVTHAAPQITYHRTSQSPNHLPP